MWGTSTNYPSIFCYGDAKRTYENTKPLRGTTDTRPLERRSSRAKAFIEKHGDEYHIKLYRTTIVVYYPDGKFHLNHGNWSTSTTAAALSRMSPLTCWTSKGNLIVSTRGRFGYADGKKFVIPSGGMDFTRAEDGEFIPHNPPVAKQYKTRVKKDETKAARKYYAEVPELIKGLCGVMAGTVFKSWSGTLPTIEVRSTPLDHDDAVEFAMRFVNRNCEWSNGQYVVSGDHKKATQEFWKHVYSALHLHERYSIDLPYGEVPK